MNSTIHQFTDDRNGFFYHLVCKTSEKRKRDNSDLQCLRERPVHLRSLPGL
jgi:hypothetical protein